MRTIDIITQALIIGGGLNWLLVGLFQFDLVAALFGGQAGAVARVVYVIVGVSAIWQLIRFPARLEDRPAVTTTTGTAGSGTTGASRRPGDSV